MIFIASLAIVATWYFCLPWWMPLAVMWPCALAFLPFSTWRDFNAGMSLYRVKRGGAVVLPPEAERCLEPDHVWVVRYLLWPMAALRNFMFNLTWGTVIFADLPRWGELGFTMRMNRYRRGPVGTRRDKAFAVCKRWLNRFDSRGVHE